LYIVIVPENNLYLGTSDGYLIHYWLDDQVSSNDVCIFD